tara:strand:- start:21 stop:320 length:300 start_codon:yes stop_codon:yes gene_type:complete
MKEEVEKWIRETYSEMNIYDLIDEAVPDFLDDDWEEDGEYEDSLDWYRDHNNGEAEDQVRDRIEKEIEAIFKVTREEYKEIVGQDLYETIIEVYDILDT